jgi:hypothetical protein
MVDTLRSFVGMPPVGFEYLEYFGVLIVFLLLFRFVADLFRTLANLFKIKF